MAFIRLVYVSRKGKEVRSLTLFEGVMPYILRALLPYLRDKICEKHARRFKRELLKEGSSILGWLEYDHKQPLLHHKVHCRFCEEMPEGAEQLRIEIWR